MDYQSVRSQRGHLFAEVNGIDNRDNVQRRRLGDLPSYRQIIAQRNDHSNLKESKGGNIHERSNLQFHSDSLRRSVSNPFLAGSSSDVILPYSSSRRSFERTKWLAYAKNRHRDANRRTQITERNGFGSQTDLQDLADANFRDVYSPRPASVQSEFTPGSHFHQNGLGSYPYSSQSMYHSTQSLHRVHRPSRRMFSSGLRVRFSDEVDYSDDSKSVCSDRSSTLSKYDEEIRKILDQRRNYLSNHRNVRLSPSSSTSSDQTFSESTHNKHPGSVYAESSNLHTLLPDLSHVQNEEDRSTDEEMYMLSSRGDNPYLQEDYLEGDIDDPKFYRDFQYHMYVNVPGHYPTKNWGQKTSDSPPDSAIDTDYSSVHSALSLDLHKKLMSPTNPSSDIRYNHSAIHNSQVHENNSHYEDDRNHFHHSGADTVVPPGFHISSDFRNQTNVFQKDSDVDSGISQEHAIDDTSFRHRIHPHNSHLPLKSHPQVRPGSATPRSHSHPVDTLLAPNGNSDEEEIAREILLTQSVRKLHSDIRWKQNGRHAILENEVDDTDPSLGISRMSEEDMIIQERYRRKRNPSPFVIMGRSALNSERYRPHSAPLWNKSKSESNVSVLCTPRNRAHESERPVSVIGGSVDLLHNTYEDDFSGVKDYVMDRRRMSEASSDSVSTLHKSQELRGETFRNHEIVSREIEEEIRTKSIDYSSSEDEDFKETRGTTPTPGIDSEEGIFPPNEFGRVSQERTRTDLQEKTDSALNSREPEEIEIPGAFPKISDRSAKKKLHFNFFKTKKGHYCPEGNNGYMPSGSLTLPAFASPTRTAEVFQEEGEIVGARRYGSDGDLLEDHGTMAVSENFSTGSLPEEFVAPVCKSDEESEEQSDTDVKSRKSSLADEKKSEADDRRSSADDRSHHFMQWGAHGGNIQEKSEGAVDEKTDENDDRFYPQVLMEGVVMYKPREFPKCVLDQQDIQQLDDMYDFSDSQASDDDENDNEDDDESLASSQAIYPADMESAVEQKLKEYHVTMEEEDQYSGTDNDGIISVIVTDRHGGVKAEAQTQKLAESSPSESEAACEMFNPYSSVKETRHSPQNVMHGTEERLHEESREDHCLQEQLSTSELRRGDDRGTHSSPEPGYSAIEPDNDQDAISNTANGKSQPHIYASVNYSNKARNHHTLPLHTGDVSSNGLFGGQHTKTGQLEAEVPDGPEFGERKGKPLSREFSFSEPNIYTITDEISLDGDHNIPPLPQRNYTGSHANLADNPETTAPKTSKGKLSTWKAAARAKFKNFKKAVTRDKNSNKTDQKGKEVKGQEGGEVEVLARKPQKAKKSGISLKKLFKKKTSKGRSTDLNDHFESTQFNSTHAVNLPTQRIDEEPNFEYSEEPMKLPNGSNEQITSPGGPEQLKLLESYPDGSRLLQITRPQDGPIGLYIAKGDDCSTNGILVSRFSEDKDPRRDFAGLLNIGDEILEVNGYIAMDMTLDDVYDLLSQKPVITIKVMPYFARDVW